MRFGAALAALHDYKEPPCLPFVLCTPRYLPQYTLTHFIMSASIDAPATTLLAARLLRPVSLIPSLTPTSTCCRTAFQSLIRSTPRCDPTFLTFLDLPPSQLMV